MQLYDVLGKYLNENKKPKFKIGDKVQIKEFDIFDGKIVEIGEFDSLINQYRYMVKNNKTGKTKIWAEEDLEKK